MDVHRPEAGGAAEGNRMRFALDPLQCTLNYNSVVQSTQPMNVLALKWSALGIQIPLERETLCQSLALGLQQLAPFYK